MRPEDLRARGIEIVGFEGADVISPETMAALTAEIARRWPAFRGNASLDILVTRQGQIERVGLRSGSLPPEILAYVTSLMRERLRPANTGEKYVLSAPPMTFGT